jgi:hypothetical protein
MSFGQERLWRLLSRGSDLTYVTPRAVRLRGDLDVRAFSQSLGEIARRHESLRTNFTVIAGDPVQVISPPRPFDVPLVDLTGLPKGERRDEAGRLIDKEVRRPFDLSRDLPLRVSLLRLSEDEHIAVFVMHHIGMDAWSIAVLARELGLLYETFSSGRQSPLLELRIQYGDFAIWQRQWLRGDTLEAQLSYWRRQLGGAPEQTELPADHPQPRPATFDGAKHRFAIPKDLSESLRKLSGAEGVSLYMTLLAAFNLLLHSYSGQDDIVVGSSIANRRRGELEHLIGFFVSALALRTSLSGDPTFLELLRRVREVALEGFAHQEIPVEKVVLELYPERELSHAPLFNVMFVLQNAPTASLGFEGLQVEPLMLRSDLARYDLSLLMSEHEHGMTAVIDYKLALFDGETIQRMADRFQTLLEGIVARPEGRISDLLPYARGATRV